MKHIKLFETKRKKKRALKMPERRKKKKKIGIRDFPGGSTVKNLPANAGDRGSISDLGRLHMPQSS